MRPVLQSLGSDPRSCTTCAGRELCPLSRLADREFEPVAKAWQLRRYAKGMVVVEQGEPAQGLFVNRSAYLRLVHVQASGKTAAVSMLGPGGVLGLAEIMLGTAHQRRCEVVIGGEIEYLSKRDMAHFILASSSIAVEMLIQASQQILAHTEDLCRIPSSSSEERLLHSLRDFSATGNGATSHEIPLLTIQELADHIGCSRQWTSKILGEMESRGVISRSGRRITLTRKARAAGPSVVSCS
jgi:CRP/FNR family cyclic AMP-dependent transcriptional regulator